MAGLDNVFDSLWALADGSYAFLRRCAEPTFGAQPICWPHRASGDQPRYPLGCRRAHSVVGRKEADTAQRLETLR